MFESFKSSLFGSIGSGSNTSIAAPVILPSFSASISAFSSIIGPLAVLMR